MRFYWVLPCYQKLLSSKPLKYFFHLFGGEGEHSLLSYLKSKDLALDLSAGGDHEVNVSTFEIVITLTDNGIQKYMDVIEAVFQFA